MIELKVFGNILQGQQELLQFCLLNSVAVLNNGSVVVADGGLNEILLIDPDRGIIKRVGRTGYGKCLFKEVVGVFVSPTQEIYVADWHNHRVVCFDCDLNYLREFGSPTFTQLNGGINGPLKIIKFFAGFLLSKGSYIQSHFGTETQAMASCEKAGYSAWIGVLASIYWCKRHNGLIKGIKKILFPDNPMCKPNGVAFLDGERIIVSQKNSRSFNEYSLESDGQIRQNNVVYGPEFGQKFGRLANLHWAKDTLFVCDEESSVIWCFDKDFVCKGKIIGGDSGIGRFAPFSCCMVRENLLAVCGGRNVQLIEISSSRVIYTTQNFGEVHGVAYDGKNNRLYVADRGSRKLRVLEIIDCKNSVSSK